MKPTLFFLVFATAALARAQAPARDQPRPTPETAIIRGRVLVAGSDNGVRKARVTLAPETGALRDPIYTDNEGRFEFTGLAAGRYGVWAWKSGWVETKFGARTYWDRHVSIAVTAGAIVEGVEFALERGAAISGHVMDEDGEPLVSATVEVGRAIMQNGRLLFISAGGTTTDDLGEYRVGGLPAGAFVVAAFGFPPPSARASSGGQLDPMLRPHTVYYPQSLTVTQATPVSLRTGDDISSVDVTFVASGPVAHVSGRVVDPQSQRPTIAFVSDGNGIPQASMGLNMSASPTGEFSVPLAPGEYTVVAQNDDGGVAMQRITVGQEDISLAPSERSGGIGPTLQASPRPDGKFDFTNVAPGDYLLQTGFPGGAYASQYVTVADADVAGLSIRTSIGSTVRGRITLDGAQSSIKVNEVKVYFILTDLDLGPPPGNYRAKIDDEGNFEYVGLFGPLLLRPFSGSNWMVQLTRPRHLIEIRDYRAVIV
ncbi:MAG: carboxypeptidase-like regulatory domain-containing protein [Acidobacteriia bacterium]|nr:carboxypeptidase-like regulatory domain-containing protein [Terriglobia bacterium]